MLHFHQKSLLQSATNYEFTEQDKTCYYNSIAHPNRLALREEGRQATVEGRQVTIVSMVIEK